MSAHPDYLGAALTLDQLAEWHIFLAMRGDPFIRNQIWAQGGTIKEQWLFPDEATKALFEEAKALEAELESQHG